MAVSSWYFYDFATEITIAVPKWKANCFEQERQGDGFPGTVYSRVVPRYGEKFQKCGIILDFAQAAWHCFKMEDLVLKVVLLSEKQCAFVRHTVTRREEVEVYMGNAGKD